MKGSSCTMSNREDVKDDDRDPLGPSPQVPSEIPTGFDRRKFIMRGAVISAAAVMNGCARSETEEKPLRRRPPAPRPPGPEEGGGEGGGAGEPHLHRRPRRPRGRGGGRPGGGGKGRGGD